MVTIISLVSIGLLILVAALVYVNHDISKSELALEKKNDDLVGELSAVRKQLTATSLDNLRMSRDLDTLENKLQSVASIVILEEEEGSDS